MNDDRFRLITTGKLSPEGDKDRIYQYFIKTKGLSASNAQSFFFGSPVTLAKNLNWENAEAIKNNFYILTSLPTYAYNLTAHARLLVWSTLILMQKLYNYYIEITQMIRFSKMDFRKRDPSEHEPTNLERVSFPQLKGSKRTITNNTLTLTFEKGILRGPTLVIAVYDYPYKKDPITKKPVYYTAVEPIYASFPVKFLYRDLNPIRFFHAEQF